MAGSRLASFGTIFSRMTGLLESGAVKDVPIWYNVYKKYPPFYTPNRERDLPPQDPIPEIVYEEDFERAELARGGKASSMSKVRTKETIAPKKVGKNLRNDIITEITQQR